LTLSEQQHLVWVMASQSTKQQDTQEIWEVVANLALPWFRLWYPI